MGDPSVARALDAAVRAGADFTVRHDHAPPGGEATLEHLVVGPAGVFVVRTARPGLHARRAQARDLQRDVRAVRAVLDAAGLRALAATPVLCRPPADARSPRIAGATAHGDVTAVLGLLQADRRLGAATVRAARLALDPPAFVADVRPAAPAAAPRPARPARAPAPA